MIDFDPTKNAFGSLRRIEGIDGTIPTECLDIVR